MKIDLIAIDMDGTLLNPDSRISAKDAQALRDATQAGVTVAICSGRMPEDIDHHAAEAGLDCWVCGGNGCRVYDAPYGKLMEEHKLDTQSALACIELLEQYEGRGLVLHAGVGPDVALSRVPEDEWYTQWLEKRERRGRSPVRFGMAALREAAALGIHNMLISFEGDDENNGALNEAAARFRTLPGVYITSSWEYNFEVLPTGVNKGTALAKLAARLGIPRERVMAIGDQENDREMLLWAGYGVAMGNATPEIKAISRFVTSDNAHYGVAEAVRRVNK
ncbi:MAG: Cof-type HAD-IIB family hydrolase [Clostridia bacterium]|nr:Cof-type HAD-IIB family hydrolase [Clostridia bacterium]